MKDKVENAKIGENIKYGGREFTVIQKRSGGVYCFLDKSFMLETFFKNEKDVPINNYKNSNLVYACECEFVGDLVANGGNLNDFVMFETELEATDGSNEYGSILAIAAPISLFTYGKCKDIIPVDDDWWYTLTPESTPWNKDPSVLSCNRVWIIGPNGRYSIGHCRNKYGVRPMIKLRPETEVEFDI